MWGVSMETILEMKNISKHFSGVKALDKIQFDLRKEKSIHFSEKTEPESQP